MREGNGDKGRLPIDYDGGVVGAVGVRDRGVDVACYGRFAGCAVVHL